MNAIERFNEAALKRIREGLPLTDEEILRLKEEAEREEVILYHYEEGSKESEASRLLDE